MNQTQKRQTAISAARSELRAAGDDPATIDAATALTVLDDLARQEPNLTAAVWYMEASDNQIRTFRREWAAWQRRGY